MKAWKGIKELDVFEWQEYLEISSKAAAYWIKTGLGPVPGSLDWPKARLSTRGVSQSE